MKYGCIGEHLSHSFSKEIHSLIADYDYELREIPFDSLKSFITSGDFSAINVTIPYKEAVIPYLDCISTAAAEIGAVNTIVKSENRLYGYNTDFFGMTALIKHNNISFTDKKVLILGTGGTSKTAYAVAKSLGAKEIIKVSRTKKPDTADYSYSEAYKLHSDAGIIINTTPCGMFSAETAGQYFIPSDEDKHTLPFDFLPIDVSRFPQLSGIIDAVYNPLRTAFIQSGEKSGIVSSGGLYMLVAQAVAASRIFLVGSNCGFDEKTKITENQSDGITKEVNEIYGKIYRSKENIVLIGMPGCGKTTLGKKLAAILGRDLIDTDSEIQSAFSRSPAEIISESGESIFREKEAEIIYKISQKNASVISTGGGAVLKDINISRLRRNGKIFFIDRPLEMLELSDDRPLSRDPSALRKRYNERYSKYISAADTVIPNTGDADSAVNKILEALKN